MFSSWFSPVFLVIWWAVGVKGTTYGQKPHLRPQRRRDQSVPNLYPPGWPFMSNCLNPTQAGGFQNVTLKQCQNGQASDIQRYDRIAIVGGGPAGVSMALLLKKRGFKKITIFEKSNRLGGKSKNIEFDSRKYDVGTVYTFNKYECVEHLFDEFDITEVPVEGAQLLADPAIFPDGQLSPSLLDWQTRYTNANYGTNYTIATFLDQALVDGGRYVQLWTESMGSLDHYFPDEETVDFSKIGSLSFLEWLEERQLYTIIPQLHPGMSGQGYGSLAQIPAFYGLLWVHPNFIAGTASIGMLRPDWQTLWENIVKKMGILVIYNASIENIRRTQRKVTIRYRQGRRELFDHLIMAAPMPDGLTMLEDPTETELKLFSQYNYKSVRMDLVNVTDPGILATAGNDVNQFSWMDRGDQNTFMHNTMFHPATRGLSRYEWYSDSEYTGIMGILLQDRIKKRPGDAALLWQLNSPPRNGILPQAQADLTSLGIKADHIGTHHVPNYFPWKNATEVVEDRTPWRIWDLQGQKRTWYIGSYTSFESIPDVLDYNLKLINQRLCDEV